MQHFMRQLSIHFRRAAKKIELDHRYLFQNHAFEEEDIFGGYGERNLRRLLRIREDVDPDEVFQKLQPGYFKLGTQPEEKSHLKTEL